MHLTTVPAICPACRQISAVRNPAVSCQWSPDGRHLLTATTAPRLRVDNNFKVLTYYGKQVWTVDGHLARWKTHCCAFLPLSAWPPIDAAPKFF